MHVFQAPKASDDIAEVLFVRRDITSKKEVMTDNVLETKAVEESISGTAERTL